MTPFASLREYEQFIYTLPQQFPGIVQSSLVGIQRGRQYAELTGEIHFGNQHRLVVYGRLFWQAGPLTIEGYSYEVWYGSKKLFWYDSQPHPHDPILASTDPHHMHTPPDIKRHRVPAPDLSFSQPNLPVLVTEAQVLGAAL
jgi:hypothetical protein